VQFIVSIVVLCLQRLDEAQKEKNEVEEKLTESVTPVNQLEESSQERIKINAMRQSKMESLAKVNTDYVCTHACVRTYTHTPYTVHGIIKFLHSK